MGARDEEKWIKLGEAHRQLAALNITEQTVRNWADSGRLKSRRLGQDGATGHRRIAQSSVDAELARFHGETAPPPDAPEPDVPA